MPHLEEARQIVEDLSLALVLGEPGTESGPDGARSRIAALERVCASAARESATEVAGAAQSLLEVLSAPGQAPDYAACLARLQEAIDAAPGGRQPVPENAMAGDPELLSDFVLESREHITNIESQLLTLEREPDDSEALNSIFRGFHTIKGLAGFLEISQIQEFAHEVETLLDQARNSGLTITPPAIDAILESADHLRHWMAHLELTLRNQASQAPVPNEPLLGRIRALIAGASGSPEPPAQPVAQAVAPETGKDDAPAQAMPAAAPANRAGKRNENMAVKVDTAKLDYLVDMAGEMVIAESLVRNDPELAATKNPRLQRNLAQLTRITAELQKTAMAMRLVPVGPLFRRMARLVRDLSRQCGKQVEMETQGDDIQLDRTIVEELADPLMHMVRNAIDHGIETPGERQRAGKNPTARLLLRAQHQAGQVVIEIEDDGRGLDRARIAAKAIEKGLIISSEGLSDSEIFNLIFEPGFSTAAQVTNVSGRGVGMDVVRRHIEKLRGRIEIRSTPGLGATFFLKLPLTLAIIEGLIVGIGRERYIVPLFAIREMFRPGPDMVWTVRQSAEMALVRGALLPVLRLYRRFAVTPRSEDPLQSVLIVADVEGKRFCLMVDELIGKQEVVIKSLGETFENVPGIAGGAILGDGRVGLILDLEQLWKDGTA